VQPSLANKALQTEGKIGVMLPCNTIIQATPDGKVEVSAVDPIASMQAVNNPDLRDLAEEVQGKLKKVIDQL
jgi:uncharacterized protein (DUF302 family)